MPISKKGVFLLPYTHFFDLKNTQFLISDRHIFLNFENNSNMQTVLIIAGIVLLFLFLPIVVHFGATFDLLSKSGGIMVKVFGFRVLGGKVLFENNQIVFAREPSLLKAEDVVVEPEEIVVAFNISKNIFEKVVLRKIALSAVYSSEDPFEASMAKTAIETLFIQGLCWISTMKTIPKVSQVCFAGYGERKLTFSAKVRIWISIWDILTTWIASKWKELKLKFKGEKHETN